MRTWRMVVCVFLITIGAGTAATVEIRDVPRILTLGIDSRDYDAFADQLAYSILSDTNRTLFGVQEGRRKTLALGPIEDSPGPAPPAKGAPGGAQGDAYGSYPQSSDGPATGKFGATLEPR